jgi:hypothetical protein
MLVDDSTSTFQPELKNLVKDSAMTLGFVSGTFQFFKSFNMS